MRTFTNRYPSECLKCNADLPVGTLIGYDKPSGTYCIPCSQTLTDDELREFRTAKAERKAERREEWAQGHREKAAALHKRNDPYRGDIAFHTQPGHIPERARALRRTEKAWEHERTAAEHMGKAHGIRANVRVKGDKEREREAKRESVRVKMKERGTKKGDKISCALYGTCEILRINKKTLTVQMKSESGYGGHKTQVDLSWVTLL